MGLWKSYSVLYCDIDINMSSLGDRSVCVSSWKRASCAAGFMSTWHKLELFRKWEPQFGKYPHSTGPWKCLWGIFLIDGEGPAHCGWCPFSAGCPGPYHKAGWASHDEQARHWLTSMTSALDPTTRLLPWHPLTKDSDWKLNETHFSPSCFCLWCFITATKTLIQSLEKKK